MSKEITLPISIVIALIGMLLGAFVWISTQMSDVRQLIGDVRASLLGELSQQRTEIALAKIRIEWLYGREIGREVSPGWPQAVEEGGKHDHP